MMHTQGLLDELLELCQGHGDVNWRTEELLREAIETIKFDTDDEED